MTLFNDSNRVYLIIFITISLITIIIKIIYYFINRCTKNKIEGFTQNIEKKQTEHIYDKFYAEVYDQLFLSDLKNEYECVQLQKNYIKTWSGNTIRVLDLGCGTGHHLRILNRYGHHVEGLDQCKYMLKKAKINCPKAILKQGNFDNPKTYLRNQFTHILCLFYTVYYSKNIILLLQNINDWLAPNGIMVLHVVDRKKFDPVLERASSLIPLFDPQRHNKNRSTSTILEFKEFKYEADWDFKKSKHVKFTERFKFKKEATQRTNTHHLNMLTSKQIIERANKNGFELIKVIDLFIVRHNYNYLLVFKKKYGK